MWRCTSITVFQVPVLERDYKNSDVADNIYILHIHILHPKIQTQICHPSLFSCELMGTLMLLSVAVLNTFRALFVIATTLPWLLFQFRLRGSMKIMTTQTTLIFYVYLLLYPNTRIRNRNFQPMENLMLLSLGSFTNCFAFIICHCRCTNMAVVPVPVL